MAEPTPETAAAEPSTAETPPDAAAELAGDLADAVATGAVASAADAIAESGLSGGPSTPAEIDLSHLPLHTRSLLKIRVAVTVTLAKQRRPIQEITELGPGTIVKFEKTYDEPLELTVGDLPIACGDVVKVGDKFGLRIARIIRPHERFASVG